MASGISGVQELRIAEGISVLRAAANLPQTASQTIYNINGGRILLTGLVGLVTTAIQNQSTTVQFKHISTAGSTTTTMTDAVTSVGNLAVGQMIALPNAVTGTSNPVVTGLVIAKPSRLVLVAGQLQLTTGASSTGQVSWLLTYFPLDVGASVAAA